MLQLQHLVAIRHTMRSTPRRRNLHTPARRFGVTVTRNASHPRAVMLRQVPKGKGRRNYDSACAAAGQLGLMSLYETLFAQCDVATSQVRADRLWEWTKSANIGGFVLRRSDGRLSACARYIRRHAQLFGNNSKLRAHVPSGAAVWKKWAVLNHTLYAVCTQ